MSGTKELMNELLRSKDIEKTVQKHEMDFVSGNLSDYLKELLEQYKLKRLDLINRANISVSYGYQMIDGVKKPKRDKIIQLCFGFPLSLEELQKALRLGGVNELYAKNKRDAYIMFAASKGYGLEELNMTLYKAGEVLVGSEE